MCEHTEILIVPFIYKIINLNCEAFVQITH